jgi:hypothetical protein
VFNNIATGVNIYVTTANINQTAVRLARLTGSEGGAFFLVPSTNTDVTAFSSGVCLVTGCNTTVAQLTVVNNSATAVWEVLASDPLATQNFEFGITFGYTAAAGSNTPTAGISTVNGSFAPTPPSFSATDGPKAQGPAFPVPRFVDTSTARNALNVVLCRTNLLFPFVTNQAGFDTGVALANTSLDPFGTVPQTGTTKIFYYGSTTGGGAAPAPQTSQSVPAGSELVFTLSGGGNFGVAATPGFQGYLITVSNFQYCHAFAYISDIGSQKVAEGYLAIQLDVPLLNRTGQLGENEGH